MTDTDEIEPVPDHRRKSTWRTCITLGCDVRVDPWEHSFRCAAHRQRSVERSPVAKILHEILPDAWVQFVAPSDVRRAVATVQLYDPDFGHRLLDAIIEARPNLVAAVLADLTDDAPGLADDEARASYTDEASS